jgi:enoyl-CoA hydratase/carnithine racemase
MGLNEIQLGVPVPYPAACILEQLVPSSVARDMVYGGEFFHAEDLLAMGLVDEVLPLEDVVEESVKRVDAVGRFPGAAFDLIKRARIEPIEARIRKRLEEEEEAFVECWFSPQARRRLQEAAKRF